ncbi:TadE/TadG family type IV pilus assembly protein [Aestuariivita boseongensis]|uniref:TadE/TadG family type IV pilus assembly protein n=1 Tax=Aestuariivita boseongensis TaxID=1470562 RepID=UPI000682FE3D|nr:TadE family protein [Aestuariivita boseongensis]
MRNLMHHIRKACQRFRRAEDGAAIIEFAILLPIILVTFALIAEGGRLFWAYQNAITGVRDVARYFGRVAPSDLCATTPSATIGSFQAAAAAELAALSKPGVTVSINALTLECVGTAGDYRVSPAPVAVLSADLTIANLPFAPLFQLVGGTALTQIDTTITDRSRVFGP